MIINFKKGSITRFIYSYVIMRSVLNTFYYF
jgi:hypothetical protein